VRQDKKRSYWTSRMMGNAATACLSPQNGATGVNRCHVTVFLHVPSLTSQFLTTQFRLARFCCPLLKA
jgi:hypothetical protein